MQLFQALTTSQMRLTVDFTIGYGATSQVPAPIKQAILLMVGTYYETRQTVSDRTYKEIPQSAEFLIRCLIECKDNEHRKTR